MLPIFKLILLVILAAIAVILVTEPMYLMAALGFNPTSLIIVFGLSIAACVSFGIRSWSRTLMVVAGLSVLFVAVAYAVTFVPRPCHRLASIAADPGDVDPYRFTAVVFEAREPREDARIQLIDPGSELIDSRTAGTHPQASGRYTKKLVVRNQLAIFGLRGTDARGNPDCAFVAESDSLLYGTAEQRHGKVSGLAANRHCLSEAEMERLVEGMRYEVTEVDSAKSRRFNFIAKAFDKASGDLQATLVFSLYQPFWYGYPFSAYVPLSCTSKGLEWDDKPFLGLQPMPPRAPALAMAAGIKAIYDAPN